jgi:hypothetical protein
MPGYSKLSLSLRFPHQNFGCIFPPSTRSTCPAHLIPPDLSPQVCIPRTNKATKVSHEKYFVQGLRRTCYLEYLSSAPSGDFHVLFCPGAQQIPPVAF